MIVNSKKKAAAAVSIRKALKLPGQYHIKNNISNIAVMEVTYLKIYGPAYRTNGAVIARTAKQTVSIGTVPP